MSETPKILVTRILGRVWVSCEHSEGDNAPALCLDCFLTARHASEGRERVNCSRDVCPYCSGDSIGYEPAQGPNESGNWTHRPQREPKSLVLCKATGIWARDRWLRREEPPE